MRAVEFRRATAAVLVPLASSRNRINNGSQPIHRKHVKSIKRDLCLGEGGLFKSSIWSNLVLT